MKVVCIKQGGWINKRLGWVLKPGQGPERGEIVTVIDAKYNTAYKCPMYHLAEYPINPFTGKKMGFGAQYFRPIIHDETEKCTEAFLKDILKVKEPA